MYIKCRKNVESNCKLMQNKTKKLKFMDTWSKQWYRSQISLKRKIQLITSPQMPNKNLFKNEKKHLMSITTQTWLLKVILPNCAPCFSTLYFKAHFSLISHYMEAIVQLFWNPKQAGEGATIWSIFTGYLTGPLISTLFKMFKASHPVDFFSLQKCLQRISTKC